MKLREMDEHVTYLEQLHEDDGHVVLINEFNVPPQDVDRFSRCGPTTPPS
jgi:hypothetical protein